MCEKEREHKSPPPPSDREQTDRLVCFKDWRTTGVLGKGAFGTIYSCSSVSNPFAKFAMKVEKATPDRNHLKHEATVLQKIALKWEEQFPDGSAQMPVPLLIDFGVSGKFVYLVMELHGPSLLACRKRVRKEFRASTTIRFGLCALWALKCVHDAGFVHLDLKPSNFLLAAQQPFLEAQNSAHTLCTCNAAASLVACNSWLVRTVPFRLIDFGLASNPSKHTQTTTDGFRGSARYVSIRAHLDEPLHPVDDFLSLFFVLVELLRVRLPWGFTSDQKEVLFLKALALANPSLWFFGLDALARCPSSGDRFQAKFGVRALTDWTGWKQDDKRAVKLTTRALNWLKFGIADVGKHENGLKQALIPANVVANLLDFLGHICKSMAENATTVDCETLSGALAGALKATNSCPCFCNDCNPFDWEMRNVNPTARPALTADAHFCPCPPTAPVPQAQGFVHPARSITRDANNTGS